MNYRFLDLDSLLQVRLNLKLWDHHKPIYGDVTNLAAGITNITTLHLSPDSLESNKKKGWQVMPLLLNSCPNLHTLVFKGLVHRVTDKCGDACACTPNNKHNKKMKKKSKVISCLWTCQVKVLEIVEYGGSFQELKQMRHFLGNLESLETVRVGGIDADNTIFLRANLLSLPIVSSYCNNIHFI
ncbi:PREDICTED: F-box/LRR-repeat protein At1g48400-like isoform X2 [Brassica oleracea var. oleracea]|uniref:F-box/LRR-repeat protein At1g48400-like isoform X2 n=1 Tax=Brassica oleracea var. oleracea TaxID=109376 RepID=UPI0006A7382E|nr:PREDICTED: F-box/LRR-repeat protein At1g48400-like isoform X2 [Brassica oleracea var. oleracea]